jgi:uncharacterized membrane protein YeaQ/YmgE (transglycosylase-associated protein family)
MLHSFSNQYFYPNSGANAEQRSGTTPQIALAMPSNTLPPELGVGTGAGFFGATVVGTPGAFVGKRILPTASEYGFAPELTIAAKNAFCSATVNVFFIAAANTEGAAVSVVVQPAFFIAVFKFASNACRCESVKDESFFITALCIFASSGTTSVVVGHFFTPTPAAFAKGAP